MLQRAWMRGGLVLGVLLWMGCAKAADPCPALSQLQGDAQVATRIAAVACDESLRWNRPFIDADGRLASLVAYEAEASGLKDGAAPWRRVAFYWQFSGLLPAMAFKDGASDCTYAAMSLSYPGMGCRGFVIDNPWSAAFISWVMQRAGVPGFRGSASHFDYVRAARKDSENSPYALVEPMSAQLHVGDLLCYVRSGRVYGFAGLLKVIDGGNTGLPMHCDVIVAAGDGKAYAIGGNVQQAVTLRLLNLNANGQLWGMPVRADGDVACSPDAQGMCNFNRQDWAAVLQLKPQDVLATLGPVAAPGAQSNPPVAPACCVNCVLGSGMPRCPLPGQTPRLQPEPVPLQGAE